MNDSDEQHRATAEAKQQVAARAVTAPSHEAALARYLGAQHYREQQAHQQDQRTQPPAAETDDEQPDEAPVAKVPGPGDAGHCRP